MCMPKCDWASIRDSSIDGQDPALEIMVSWVMGYLLLYGSRAPELTVDLDGRDG